MNDNTSRIVYWVATSVMCAVFAFSAQMYLRNPEVVAGFFKLLNYPEYLVYPLAIAKILGIIAILSDKSKILSEWAYAGFYFDAILAFVAHYVAQDGGSMFSIIAIASTMISRYLWSKR